MQKHPAHPDLTPNSTNRSDNLQSLEVARGVEMTPSPYPFSPIVSEKLLEDRWLTVESQAPWLPNSQYGGTLHPMHPFLSALLTQEGPLLGD